MDDVQNRMADAPKKRGRPTVAEIAARPPPVPAQTVTILAPVGGIICPSCGRGMEPSIVRTTGLIKTLLCSSCGHYLKAVYSASGTIETVQPI